jgi:hypothetical protein
MMRLVVVLLAALSACARGEESPAPPAHPAEEITVESIEYRASATVSAGTLRVEARLRNVGEDPREVTFPDGCIVLIRLYDGERGAGTPAWDQREHVFCTMALQMVTLAPGETRDYATTAEVREILGDAPPGEYGVTALLRPDGGEVEIPAGMVRLEG